MKSTPEDATNKLLGQLIGSEVVTAIAEANDCSLREVAAMVVSLAAETFLDGAPFQDLQDLRDWRSHLSGQSDELVNGIADGVKRAEERAGDRFDEGLQWVN